MHPIRIHNKLLGTLILILGVLGQIQAQDTFTNGLIAYYPFDGNADDVVGTNNGAIFDAAPASDRFGNLNRAYSFNGTTAYIRCPDTGFPDGDSPRTVSLWIRMASRGVPDGNTMFITSYGVDGPDNAFYSMVVWGQSPPYIVVGKSGGGDTPRWDGPTTNVWYQVTITYSNFTARLFINGGNRVEATRTYHTQLNGYFYIGRYLSDGSSTFDGQIDDIRIYNRALSSSEVRALYLYESGPHVDLIKAVKPSFSLVAVGTNYQLQVSGDLANWTNHGSVFTATNSTLVYPEYFDVLDWNTLFFRLQVSP